MLSEPQAKYLAHWLTRSLPSDNLGKLTASLQDAQVDLTPHQIDAALFAFKSPLSKGAILADEVGLGKTIEAGIILSQFWAEHRRHLLIIAPANLRKQWAAELQEKFYLPSRILESKIFNGYIKQGNLNPFNCEEIVICSYQFAELGAPKKALIFTESRQTQDFLFELLEKRGYKGKVVLFNGSNSDKLSTYIYKAWKEKYKGTTKVTGSATADKRAALVDYFREEATIMIATEATAEGINLQFCSLVVNYDMPWNPQRIDIITFPEIEDEEESEDSDLNGAENLFNDEEPNLFNQ
ncbi:MAG: DEAD/DEAH box helicase [Muribaculaceae bacterium]|nr:DEAD/DEAH box helicase [Muribaculaceae bacterium]